MSYFKLALDYFEKSRTNRGGEFIPLVKNPNSDIQSKLGRFIPVGKGIYMLLGGQSGGGKTAIVESEFILKVYFWWKRNKDKTNIYPYWFLRSMERPTKHKIGKWICYLIYIEHGITLDVPTLYKWPNKKRDLTDHEIKLFKSYKRFFEEEFENHITIISGSENPTGLHKTLLRFYRERGKDFKATNDKIFLNGTLVKKFTGEHKDEKDNRLFEVIEGRKISQYEHTYVPDNENEIIFHITDHIQALRGENGLSDKQLLDKHSEYCREFRDIYGTAIINISQLNRGAENAQRKYSKGAVLDIVESDFKGSSNMYQDKITY